MALIFLVSSGFFEDEEEGNVFIIVVFPGSSGQLDAVGFEIISVIGNPNGITVFAMYF